MKDKWYRIKSPVWLLEYPDGTKEIVENRPDYSNDALIVVPKATKGISFFRATGDSYTPKVWRVIDK